jgi:quinol monooxygenase YgiN
MTTLSLDNKLTTAIVIFTVQPDRQQALIEAIAEFLQIVKTQPGFVSASLHRSLDGFKVVNYAQWQSMEAFEAFRKNPEVSPYARKLWDFPPPEFNIYEIFASESKIGTPKIEIGKHLTHLAEFRTKPENQPQLMKLAQDHLLLAMEVSGLLSATFHRSVDGTRIFNYGQWLNSEAIDELVEKPGFIRKNPYWQGLAEIEYHLYEVAYLESSHIN